ncbi:hypothetical protein BRCON_0829 [Candidatus Sumerlaea chitinivorans]|uniref:Purine nucleoside phosphorylase n=1 Tax=Sumerlaea chitinivorans TaxID=2250252 RepID=A0A2Z4Y3U3_SUMC1|nr:hypothetical protein BRCON_0829 [Candidatus Sumerlaea chitinivorans]
MRTACSSLAGRPKVDVEMGEMLRENKCVNPTPPDGIQSNPKDWMVQCSSWVGKWDWLLHCTTTRFFPDGSKRVSDELRKLQGAAGISSAMPVAYCRQRHTNRVAIVTRQAAEKASLQGEIVFEATDALVTAQPGIALAVYTADCVPIFLVEETIPVVALVHAGWRGTLASIARETVFAMSSLGANPARIHAWIGPAICGVCYEVSEELLHTFIERFSHLAPAAEFCRGRMLDLPRLNALQLQAAGVPDAHISNSRLCTFHEKQRFYSYRAEGQRAGRLISLIGITSPAKPM